MNKHKTLVIIGAGGHGRVVADCAESIAIYHEIIFLDDCFSTRKNNSHWPIVGPIAHWTKYTDNAGVVIFANAVVNIGTRIDEGCIINTAATIDHDCHIQAYCHISPGVNIAGGVEVGTRSWLGIGSSVVEYITIAENTQSGAGAVITHSTQSNTLYLGVPAQPSRSLT